MQKRQRKIDTLILVECGTEDYGTQELENNHIKEKGKEEENRIVPMKVSREKGKKATAKRMEIETNLISEDVSRYTRPIVTNNKDRNAKERIELEESKLTKITQGENEEEVLVNRRKHRLILEGEDMYKAINRKINYGNTFLFWRDISRVERPDRRSTSAIKWNQRNLSPDSDKRKKITHSHNKENESGETTKFKNHYDEDKRKEGHNVERSRYIESLDEKLQIILQKLDKIEANRSKDGDKSTWKEIGPPIVPNSCKGRTKESISSKIKAEESLVESIKRDNDLGIRIACHNINGLKSNGLKLEALSDWASSEQLDVVEIAETNIAGKEGYFLAKDLQNYKAYWTEANPEKKKEPGVGF
ncbi:18055_t:CDS:2 [Gigaspora margarita]|uniref:18055_t:CDS:1 n=1 Tax=Gigaspora margarita TaxID=4874 RepID=A0ABN7URP6_GIGMA|nr:18055_t:CDS:2 [Gigaspora margarita]